MRSRGAEISASVRGGRKVVNASMSWAKSAKSLVTWMVSADGLEIEAAAAVVEFNKDAVEMNRMLVVERSVERCFDFDGASCRLVPRRRDEDANPEVLPTVRKRIERSAAARIGLGRC
jgi:hypothetical protein